MAKQIELTQGFVALVDDIDFEYLRQFNWCIANGYAVRRGENKKHLGMHRVVLERKLGRKLLKSERPDHKDLNRSNNTRDNIRLATQSQNVANIPKYAAKKSSRFKGVSYHKVSGKWVARIKIHGHLYHIGTFSNEESAARTYDKWACFHFGEFATLNFPDELKTLQASILDWAESVILKPIKSNPIPPDIGSHLPPSLNLTFFSMRYGRGKVAYFFNVYDELQFTETLKN